MKKQFWKIILLSAALGSIAIVVWLSWIQVAERGTQLADGSWLKIHNVIVAEEVSCNFSDDKPAQRFFGLVLPEGLRSILSWALHSPFVPQGNASLHMSGEGKVCLFIVTARDGLPPTSTLDLRLLTISDDQGRGANSSSPFATVETRARFQGWAWEDFPKHSQTLLVRCWAARPKGQLVEAAHFKIRNPGYEPEGQSQRSPSSIAPGFCAAPRFQFALSTL
jgi:hypothetical protein